MKKTIYKNINKRFTDALYWIENKKSISCAEAAIDQIIDSLFSLAMFLDSDSAFYCYIMRKIAEIYIADGRSDVYLNQMYMRGFYTGK